MKLLSAILLLAALCPLAARAQAKADKEPRLRLTASIVEKKHHCSNFVGFTVRLTFENAGAKPILLDKRSLVSGLTVSRDPEEAAAGRHEVESRPEYFGSGDYFDVDPSDMSNIIKLKPGETYAIDRGIGSFWVAEGTPLPEGYLNAGTHYLQVRVATWTYFADPATFRQKWSNKGFLWTEGLSSVPIPFTVEVARQSPECG